MTRFELITIVLILQTISPVIFLVDYLQKREHKRKLARQRAARRVADTMRRVRYPYR